MTFDTAKLRQDACTIFEAGLQAVDAEAAVLQCVDLKNKALQVGGRHFSLKDFDRVYVIGFGKAAAAMASALEKTVGDQIDEGIVVVKHGYIQKLNTIQLFEAGHPVPDQAGVRAAGKLIELAQKAKETDLVICLISGGGSALLPLPAEGIALSDKQIVTQKLLECGAAINEINAVRKHISKVKGGQLARAIHPATLLTLILSDVVGDPLDVIASGPTVPDSTTFADTAAIFDKYEFWQALPAAIVKHIRSGMDHQIADTPKSDDAVFFQSYTKIIANNLQALREARQKAKALNYNCLLLSSFIEGETREIARMHAAIARQILDSGEPVAPPACLISGGETTVTIQGAGKGGRNQEFCLAAAIDIAGLNPVVIFSAGTDGTDGPTDAAGAICDGASVQRAQSMGLEPKTHLRENNAYPFFEKLNDLVKTGPTNTNVMDLRIVLVGVD